MKLDIQQKLLSFNIILNHKKGRSFERPFFMEIY